MPAIGKAATATKADILDLSKAGCAAISNLGLAPEELTRAFDMMALAGKEGGFELKDMAQYLPANPPADATRTIAGCGWPISQGAGPSAWYDASQGSPVIRS